MIGWRIMPVIEIQLPKENADRDQVLKAGRSSYK
jgi:hypothetical protein